jgi:hypothetical protein
MCIRLGCGRRLGGLQDDVVHSRRPAIYTRQSTRCYAQSLR